MIVDNFNSTNLDSIINNSMILKSDFNGIPKLKLYSPTIVLSGHQGEIYSGKFSNEGFLYASGGHDKNIMLWEVYEEKCRNLTTLVGHTNAVLGLVFSQDDTKIYSCSADNTVSIWDIYEAKRIKKLKDHHSYVNSIDATKKGPELVFILY